MSGVVVGSPLCAYQDCNTWPQDQLKHCSVCKDVYYCSKTCQINDWKEHQKSCENKKYEV